MRGIWAHNATKFAITMEMYRINSINSRKTKINSSVKWYHKHKIRGTACIKGWKRDQVSGEQVKINHIWYNYLLFWNEGLIKVWHGLSFGHKLFSEPPYFLFFFQLWNKYSIIQKSVKRIDVLQAVNQMYTFCCLPLSNLICSAKFILSAT